jgi:hypothetical protein
MSESETVTVTAADIGKINLSKKRPRNDLNTFVKAIMESDSYVEAAKKLNVNPISVQVRANELRKRGLNLKKYPRLGGGNRITQEMLDEANRLVESYAVND